MESTRIRKENPLGNTVLKLGHIDTVSVTVLAAAARGEADLG